MTVLIGGPFDGAPATQGDPAVPAIWPTWIDGCIYYRPNPVAGRPRYIRAAAGRYVFDDLSDEYESCGHARWTVTA